MSFFRLFFSILWYTLGATVICGLCVYLCRHLFVRMLGGKAGRGAVLATSIIGTPVHEIGHALMCLLFGHKITDMSLWQPASADGTLGYVSHSYNSRNPYKVLGNLFIGVGPIFSGLGVLTLMLWLCFPSALDQYLDASRAMVASGENGFVLFFEGLKLFPHAIGEAIASDDVSVWLRIIGVIVILSVALHIELSPADIKGSLGAIPLYLLLVLLVTVICSLIGSSASSAVTEALAMFSATLTSLFVIVLVVSLLELLIALPVWIIRKLVQKK